jgi:hypothetical protein
MIGERFARGTLALEGLHRLGFGGDLLRGQLILGRGGLQFLEPQLHLLEETRRALRAMAVQGTAELLDLQLHAGDQRPGTGVHRQGASRGGLGFRCAGLGFQAGGALGRISAWALARSVGSGIKRGAMSATSPCFAHGC